MDIKSLIDDYANWLKSEIKVEKVGEYYELTTPYLDNANDYLQIYVKQDGNDILFSDDGAIINSLQMNGISLTGHRKQMLDSIVLQYGIARSGNELISKANPHNFAQKKHLFIQAMLRIEDVYATTRSKVASLFLDDVYTYFDNHEIFYSDKLQVNGTSGFTHSYDFLLQRTRSLPERFCQTLNKPNKSNVGLLLFQWSDTKPSRKSDSKLIVFLNDENKIPGGVIDAISNYNADFILWSEKDKTENLSKLAS